MSKGQRLSNKHCVDERLLFNCWFSPNQFAKAEKAANKYSFGLNANIKQDDESNKESQSIAYHIFKHIELLNM